MADGHHPCDSEGFPYKRVTSKVTDLKVYDWSIRELRVDINVFDSA